MVATRAGCFIPGYRQRPRRRSRGDFGRETVGSDGETPTYLAPNVLIHVKLVPVGDAAGAMLAENLHLDAGRRHGDRG